MISSSSSLSRSSCASSFESLAVKYFSSSCLEVLSCTSSASFVSVEEFRALLKLPGWLILPLSECSSSGLDSIKLDFLFSEGLIGKSSLELDSECSSMIDLSGPDFLFSENVGKSSSELDSVINSSLEDKSSSFSESSLVSTASVIGTRSSAVFGLSFSESSLESTASVIGTRSKSTSMAAASFISVSKEAGGGPSVLWDTRM